MPKAASTSRVLGRPTSDLFADGEGGEHLERADHHQDEHRGEQQGRQEPRRRDHVREAGAYVEEDRHDRVPRRSAGRLRLCGLRGEVAAQRGRR
jgi:hypothetical protein